MKFYRIVNFIFFLITFWLQFPILEASCSVITLTDENMLYKHDSFMEAKSIRTEIAALMKEGDTETKAKGKIGETAAAQFFNTYEVFGNNYYNIRDVLRSLGCEVMADYLRDKGNRGIDDIFVVIKKDGTPDYRYKPVFHESKFSSPCKIELSNTETMCQQMSLKWLEANMEGVVKRATEQASLCLGDHVIKVKSCESCVDNFQEIIMWLQKCIKDQHCFRTASVLCPKGELKIYEIN